MVTAKPPRPKPLVRVPEPDPGTNVLIPGLSLSVVIPGTPHTCLRPNDPSDRWTKARHRKQQRRDTYLATVNVINSARLSRDMTPFPAGKRLRVSYTIAWEKGRQAHDDTGALGALKGAEDGFADAIGVDDAWFDVGEVHQVRDAGGVGWVQIHCEVADGG